MNTIGVAAVIGGEELNSYALEIFTGILVAAARYEQSATMFTLHDWDRDTGRLHNWCDGRIDGLIMIAPTLTPEAAKGLPTHAPFVALHSNFQLPNVINIESDEERGAYEMVRYLVAQGHRRIMHVTGDRGLIGPERRIKGYKRALAISRLPFSNSLFVPATFGDGAGRTAIRQWLKRHAGEPLPDAVFCANDSMAIGCIEALAEVGLRVPDDISVAGFDDALVARTTVPQLTTVRQPLRAMGFRAVEVLLDSIRRQNGESIPQNENPIVFPVELALRASVAPPPVVHRIVPVLQ